MPLNFVQIFRILNKLTFLKLGILEAMQLVVALFVDSWQQPSEKGNFAVFEVCLRGEDNSQWSVKHRYSEFYQFHHEAIWEKIKCFQVYFVGCLLSTASFQ